MKVKELKAKYPNRIIPVTGTQAIEAVWDALGDDARYYSVFFLQLGGTPANPTIEAVYACEYIIPVAEQQIVKLR